MGKNPYGEALLQFVLQPVPGEGLWERWSFDRYEKGSSFERAEHPPPEHPSPCPPLRSGSRPPAPLEREGTREVGSGVPPLGMGSHWSRPSEVQKKRDERPMQEFG